MSWAWINGHLTEHEMELEHGLELEKIKEEQEGELKEFDETRNAGGGRVYPLHKEGRERLTVRRFYGMIQGMNESIKNWKGM
jgi:hypothetical protein